MNNTIEDLENRCDALEDRVDCLEESKRFSNSALEGLTDFIKSICDNESSYNTIKSERDVLKAENAALRECETDLLKVAEMVITISEAPPGRYTVADTMDMIFAAKSAIAKVKENRKDKNK